MRVRGARGDPVRPRGERSACSRGSHTAPLRSRDAVEARRRSPLARRDRDRRRPRAPTGKAQRGFDDDHRQAQAGSEQGRHAARPAAGRAPDRRPRQRPDPPRRPPPADTVALPDGCRRAKGRRLVFDDDTFVEPGGKALVTNEEENHDILSIDIKTHAVTNLYGQPGVKGSAPGLLNTPDDAYVLPDGTTTVADAYNCRILFIRRHRIVRQIGRTGGLRARSAADARRSQRGHAPSGRRRPRLRGQRLLDRPLQQDGKTRSGRSTRRSRTRPTRSRYPADGSSSRITRAPAPQ